MHLTKEQSRERWRQMRQLWCKWDPIGVVSLDDWPRDEYDAYLGSTLRLLEEGASRQEIADYLEQVTIGHMGLSETAGAKLDRLNFAAELREWYERGWTNSHV